MPYTWEGLDFLDLLQRCIPFSSSRLFCSSCHNGPGKFVDSLVYLSNAIRDLQALVQRLPPARRAVAVRELYTVVGWLAPDAERDSSEGLVICSLIDALYSSKERAKSPIPTKRKSPIAINIPLMQLSHF